MDGISRTASAIAENCTRFRRSDESSRHAYLAWVLYARQKDIGFSFVWRRSLKIKTGRKSYTEYGYGQWSLLLVSTLRARSARPCPHSTPFHSGWRGGPSRGGVVHLLLGRVHLLPSGSFPGLLGHGQLEPFQRASEPYLLIHFRPVPGTPAQELDRDRPL